MNEILHLFYTVINRQQGLQSPSLQHIGELHVNRFHRASVLQYPVLVRVRGIIVAWSSEGTIATRNYLQKKGFCKKLTIFSIPFHGMTWLYFRTADILAVFMWHACFHDQRHRIHPIKGKIHNKRVLCAGANFRISTLGCNRPDYSQLFFICDKHRISLHHYCIWLCLMNLKSVHFVR